MGSASVYITASSGAYLSANVSWNSSGLSSGSSITVNIDVSSNGGWRLKKGSTIYFEQQGNLKSNFTGNVGTTYQFQLWDAVEERYQYKNFTVTQDSSGGGGDSGGGGGSGGGGSTISCQVFYYNSNGALLYKTTETGRYFIVKSGDSVTRPNPSSSNSNYTIIGNANGGTFSNGSETASITAIKTITTAHIFSEWRTNDNFIYRAGQEYWTPEKDELHLYPIFENDVSTSYSNNSLSNLPTPSYTGSTTATLKVTFDAKGGSVSTTSKLVNATIVKTFGGWMSSSTGTTTISSLESEGTVYAKWDVSYPDATVILPLPTRKGYIFNGWSTSTSGTNLYQAGAEVSISGDTTFYAIWTEKEKPSGGVFIHDGTMWQLISG